MKPFIPFKQFIREKQQKHFESSVFTKEIGGSVYKYTPVGDHLFKREDSKGHSTFVKHLPEDVY